MLSQEKFSFLSFFFLLQSSISLRKCTTALLSTIYDGHLGCFQILVIVNNAAMNVGVRLFFELMSPVSLDILPEVRSLGQKAVPFLIF